MITVPELAADALGEFLSEYMQRRYGPSESQLTQLVPSVARIALESIGNSDALYHNIEHTMLVTLACHDILRGRALQSDTPASDYAHIIVACLMHDIGYVRGILPGDDDKGFVVDDKGKKVKLERGASDAALTPYHVDRSKLFVKHRFSDIELLDETRIANAVEATRFPATLTSSVDEIGEEGALLRAADLIGQLGDPHYIRKANALYYEFDEAGLNRQLGYANPADLVEKYPAFYYNMIAPFIQPAVRHLNVTASGRQWIANLYSNVFRAERDIGLSGPQQ
ncbi:MAG TPA: metal-dependent phosphohydrolase [Bauldia sp.]|nr:metal-dependent phosphohydrolase [Bauldia sp.]